jgi:hypothetical protein
MRQRDDHEEPASGFERGRRNRHGEPDAERSLGRSMKRDARSRQFVHNEFRFVEVRRPVGDCLILEVRKPA